ncbi:MAG: rRNA maturation RNase YbeY [Epsilonproteobacteria bacterium]|nr:rRNA maturation RNase YbeY [Campylobacterota bacterium]NPA57335.1 rRNA maturation RNase YbeY [Campylobacterota bacterium]
MIDLDNRTPFDIPYDIIEQISKKLTERTIELLVVDSETIRRLNREFRGIDNSTDVLSFPLAETPGAPLGSVVINVDRVREGALEYGHSEREEFLLLFIHGLLHLLGYDHERDQGEMRRREEELIEEFNLPKSLIVRNEP